MVNGHTEAAPESAPPDELDEEAPDEEAPPDEEELDDVAPEEDPEVDPLDVTGKRDPSGTLASELTPDEVAPAHAACPSTVAATSAAPTRTKSKLRM
jgi:hypothetical protein